MIFRHFLFRREKPKSLIQAIESLPKLIEWYQARDNLKLAKFITGSKNRSEKLQKVLELWEYHCEQVKLGKSGIEEKKILNTILYDCMIS